MSPEPLAGYSVGITAARRREEFGAALARRGAKIVYGPAIRIVPLTDDRELLAATRRCLDAPLDLMVATTGIGFRGWIEAADTWGMAEDLVSTLGQATLIARGPKARGAIRATGLKDAWSPASESSTEVLEHLVASHDLPGKRVAVQLHGDPLPELVETLRRAGAEVIEVPVYRWVPPADIAPLHRLIEATAARSLDAVAFTSAPAAASFLQATDSLGLTSEVIAALQTDVLAACVGPVTAAPLGRAGIPTVEPTRARLGSLVREIVEQVPARRGRTVTLTVCPLELRGHCVVLGEDLVSPGATGMALLRQLARNPGEVYDRTALLACLPGDGVDEHAVEVAIARLRTALGDAHVVQTVIKRGYRLAC